MEAPQMGLLFHPPPPALAAATISKMAVKPPSPPRTTALVSPLRTTKTLTEYDAVALELVSEHPLLTEIGSRKRPRQLSAAHDLRGPVSCFDGRFERALAPGCA